jgi:hypothetical protein
VRKLGKRNLGEQSGVRYLNGYLENGYFPEPTVFAGNNKMRIFQEEIFGPAVSVTKFKTLEEAIEMGNDTVYGLGSGVWSLVITSLSIVNTRPRSTLPGAAHYPLRNTQFSSLSLVSEVWSWGCREGRLLKLAVKVSPLNFQVAEVAFQMYGSLTGHSCLGILA